MEDAARRAADRLNALGQKGDVIPMRFIEPGLVHYDDMGTVLIKKETLDKMSNSFIGRPVFNEAHKSTTSKDFSSGRADGAIVGVTYGPPNDLPETKDLPHDGWFWAKVMVWDPETKENCRNGYSLSCAYDVNTWSQSGGIHNNIPYEREVLDGEYTHLAIVPNPRYEGARIIYNSNGGNMKFAFWKKEGDKPEVRNASEIDGDKAVLAIDGKEVPVGQLVELWNSQEKAKAAAAAEAALLNASDESSIEVGGKKVTLGDLKKNYLETLQNADDDDDDEETKKKKKEAKEKAERENADDDDKEKKRKEKEDEDERKNAEKDKEEKEEKDKKERENAAHFERVRERSNSRNGNFEIPKVMTPSEKEAEGNKRYGSATK